ncbi:MAG: hypothetical protein ILO10_09100 [Kiritimatiellae bacterium]|nr:hypothetical protein [Kiritimatiellia bacterium]
MKTTPSFRSLLVLLAICLFAVSGWAEAPEDTASPVALTLAEELFAEGQYAASAIEFRRLALAADDPAESATWLWMAARAYAQPDDVHAARLALDLLDDAEFAAPPGDVASPLPIAFLRAELTLRLRESAPARYYFQTIPAALPETVTPGEADAWREFAARGAAAASLTAGNLADAREDVAAYPPAVEVVDAYAATSRKSPVVGGLLGLIPGLGYAYSGEYGNALRSLVLNGLFIWAMTETAIEDQWALFGVSTFFEFTWYTGSVYGGIDAAHRHNREALQETISTLRPVQASAIEPDPVALPILRLRFPL